MPVQFPHSNNFKIEDHVFVYAWKNLVETFGPIESRAGPLGAALPRLNQARNLAYYIAKGRFFCLEYLCRNLVPNGYRNTMQATNGFMTANQHILQQIDNVVNPLTGRQVNGASLRLKSRNIGQHCPDYMLFETDCDDLVEEENILAAAPEYAPSKNRQDFIRAFVEQIHNSPHTPIYRGRSAGNIVLGWPNRLRSYFWPTPDTGYRFTDELTNILLESARLAAVVAEDNSWNAQEQNASVALARSIFKWGKVQQREETITHENIRLVFDAAINGALPEGQIPLMNSGWTKVAAFASAHLENTHSDRHPQVIWDSRVATSIISRFDALLVAADFNAVLNFFPDIGKVNVGRGGTRPRITQLNWPNGYGNWQAQLAASALIKEIRDALNEDLTRYGRMPDPSSREDQSVPWTIRGVEMVLFMDGY